MIFARQTIVVTLLLFTVVVRGYAQTTPPKELTATITGKVTVQGNAVAGVVITLRSTERNRKLMDQRGVTNGNGEYRITNVPPGNYIVAPNAASFIVAAGDSQRSVMVNKDETIEDFDFSLIPGGVITGKVVDPEGRPVIEEEVHLFSESQQQQFSAFAAVTTDDRGVYRIFGLKPGAYKVAAGRTGDPGPRRSSGVHVRTFYGGNSDFAEAAVIKVSEGTEAANIDITVGRLLTTYTASGRIVDGTTGQPVKNVSVGYKRFGPDPNAGGSAGRTNEQGEFKLGYLPPGQYMVMAWPEPGSFFRVEEVRFEVVNQDVVGLVLKTLEDAASLSGVVVLDGTYDKEVLEQLRKLLLVAYVETEKTRKTGTSGIAAEVKPDGRFRIGGLPAGSAWLNFSGPPIFHIARVERNGIVQPNTIEVKNAENVTGLRVTVAYANASLRGVIEVENGSLPPNASLYMSASRLNTEYSGINPAVKIDARGHFVFENMVPGTHVISAGVLVPGSEPRIYQKQQVLVTAGTTSTIAIKIDLNSPKANQ